MKSHDKKDFLFSYRSRELFETMFGPFDAEDMKLLNEWVASSNADDLQVVGNIVAETNTDFVFAHQAFVENFLNKAKQVGPDALKNVFRSLYGAAVSGMRSGTAGEPMPRDLETKKRCEGILQTLPRFSPAFELYDGLSSERMRKITLLLRCGSGMNLGLDDEDGLEPLPWRRATPLPCG